MLLTVDFNAEAAHTFKTSQIEHFVNPVESELHEIIAKKPEMFESVVAKQVAQLETEIAKLTGEAEELAKEIAELSGDRAPEI